MTSILLTAGFGECSVRDQGLITEEELGEAEEQLEEFLPEVREVLAEDLGGEPENYLADKRIANSGE